MIVTEVINQSNIAFLAPQGGTICNADPSLNTPQFLPPFAAGHVYVNSVLDMLACQVRHSLPRPPPPPPPRPLLRPFVIRAKC